MSPRTVWSNFMMDEVPEEVPVLEQQEDPGMTTLQMEMELGLDLTDMYRDLHDY